MSFITVDEAKTYLRVDSSDEDTLIGVLLDSSFTLCADVARLTDEQWAVVDGDSDSDEEQEIYSVDELAHIREIIKVAVLYSMPLF